MTKLSIWIGFDPRETDAFAVARSSMARSGHYYIPIHGIRLQDLRERMLYLRPTSRRNGRLWDDLSEAHMSTEFANSRFLVPMLAETGLALFIDCDMLVRGNIEELFSAVDRSKAVTVVKHHFEPPEGVKMDGQAQTRYARKNWSSMCVWNCDHPANKALTLATINEWPGRDLHAFKWLTDDQIGEVGAEWNWLVGHSDPSVDPKIVHFTDGIPSMPGFENVPFADEWRAELQRWAA